MKKLILVLILIMMCFAGTACTKVPAGNVGVKVKLLGEDKGVSSEVLGPGRYYVGFNEELYIFPTFTQNYNWTAGSTEGSPNDEAIVFQVDGGLSVKADIGISYSIDPDKVDLVFKKYRKGVDEITDIFLRNHVRDAFVNIASNMQIQNVYGSGKEELIMKVNERVKNEVKDIGINVEKIYFVGDMVLPSQIVTAINAKMDAIQKAEQREFELRESKAAAEKVVAEAEGKGRSITLLAEAQAKANKILSASLTPEFIQYTFYQHWDGKLPVYSGGNMPVPMLSMNQ